MSQGEKRTVCEVISRGKKLLLESERTDTPLLDAEVLLGTVLGITRTELYMNPGMIVQDFLFNHYMNLLEKRGEGKPVAYITGEKEFMSMKFGVSPLCLIPRPETEILVEKALEWIGKRDLSNPRILELGTGSGCIAIALQSFLPGCMITATDISPSALEMAISNAAAHNMQHKIVFLQGDLYHALDPLENHRFDLIISNPPYIGTFENVDSAVRDYEPSLALWGGEKGLDLLKKIIEDSSLYIAGEGFLALEINPRQEALTRSILQNAGFSHLETFPDLGGLPRVILAAKKLTGPDRRFSTNSCEVDYLDGNKG